MKYIRIALLGLSLFTFIQLAGVIAISPIYAISFTCDDGRVVDTSPSQATSGDPCGSSGGTSDNVKTLDSSGDGLPVRKPSGGAGDIYTKILNPAILALSAAVVLAVVGSIVVAGVQYSTANGNSSAVASAKNRIVISILVLILYTFGFAILQWLIPGGIGS